MYHVERDRLVRVDGQQPILRAVRGDRLMGVETLAVLDGHHGGVIAVVDEPGVGLLGHAVRQHLICRGGLQAVPGDVRVEHCDVAADHLDGLRLVLGEQHRLLVLLVRTNRHVRLDVHAIDLNGGQEAVAGRVDHGHRGGLGVAALSDACRREDRCNDDAGVEDLRVIGAVATWKEDGAVLGGHWRGEEQPDDKDAGKYCGDALGETEHVTLSCVSCVLHGVDTEEMTQIGDPYTPDQSFF